MFIFLRVKQYVAHVTKKFSFLYGLETLWFNLKTFFTKRIMAGGDGWHETWESEEKIIDDWSLVNGEDGPQWIKTPKGDNTISIEISNRK